MREILKRFTTNVEAGKGVNLDLESASEVQGLLILLEGWEEGPAEETLVCCPKCGQWREPWHDAFYFCPKCLLRDQMKVEFPAKHSDTGDPLWTYEVVPGKGSTPSGLASMVPVWEAEFAERKREEVLKDVAENLRPVLETPEVKWFKPGSKNERKVRERLAEIRSTVKAKGTLDGAIARVCGMDPTQVKGGAE